jgi:hypothetical protein
MLGEVLYAVDCCGDWAEGGVAGSRKRNYFSSYAVFLRIEFQRHGSGGG